MDHYREFESIWKKFLTLCRAKLMEKSRQCTLTASAAQMSIQDAMTVWFDPYDTCGKWLKDLEKEDFQAAKRIYSILQEWVVEGVPIKKGFPEAGVWGISAASAAAGVGIRFYGFHLGTVGLLLSAAVPTIVLYPAMKAYQKSEKEKNEKKLLNEYLNQLSLLEEQILTVITPTAQ